MNMCNVFPLVWGSLRLSNSVGLARCAYSIVADASIHCTCSDLTVQVV